jgi:hypothetical protein
MVCQASEKSAAKSGQAIVAKMKNAAERLPRYEIIRIPRLIIADGNVAARRKEEAGSESVSEYGSSAAS